MNCSSCEPLLSGYADDAITAQDRAAVDAHFRGCAACRALANDIAAIRAAAGDLEPLVPPARVWHRLADATSAQRQRPIMFGWAGWQPLGALAMTAALTTGLWQIASLVQPVSSVSRQASQSGNLAAGDVEPSPEAEYRVAIARLEEATSADRDALDPETVHALNAGMTVIDRAITESRAALQSAPDSEPAQESLFEALRRKIALLQEMVALINEMRKGNQEGAARILSEINR